MWHIRMTYRNIINELQQITWHVGMVSFYSYMHSNLVSWFQSSWKLWYNVLNLPRDYVIIVTSILFLPTTNGIKSQSPPLFVPPREMGKKFSPSFHPSPHLDFEINSPPGASGTISTLKMSQMVEILISDLVLIVN